MRIAFLELPYLSVGTPPPVAIPGVSEVGPGNPLEATTRVEARRQLVGERLVLNKLVLACRLDGRFVQPLGIQLPAFDPGNFGANQCGAVFEVLRAMLRPDIELSLMKGQSFQMLYALVGRCGVAVCRASKRAVKVVFGCLEVQSRCR